MAFALNRIPGDVSKVGQGRNIGDGLSPGRQLIERNKDAANEHHRKFDH